MIRDFLEWIGGTPWSIALLESLYLWPWIESAHVLTLALFVGAAVMMDLRLVGVGFRGVPASSFTERLLPITRFAFAIMVITGLLLFYSAPLRYYHNFFFRVKMLLMVVAGLNVFVFHTRIHRSISEWDDATKPPRAARVAGMVSLASWALIVVAGRLIAYNWFECDLQPQPTFINWASSCVLEAAP